MFLVAKALADTAASTAPQVFPGSFGAEAVKCLGRGWRMVSDLLNHGRLIQLLCTTGGTAKR